MTLRSNARLRSAVVGLVTFFLISSIALAGSVGAAVPIHPETFTGPSAHGRYIVSLDVQSPTDFAVAITTPDKPHAKCPYGSYQFNNTPGILKKSGSFSVSGYFTTEPPQLKFTVTGTFTTPRSVHGTVTGNHGCGTDTFTITIPPPAALASPCSLLAKAGAGAFFGGKKPQVEQSYSPLSGTGYCHESLPSGTPRIDLYIEPSSADLNARPFVAPTRLAGLGSGATLDEFAAGSSEYEIQIFFHRPQTWVYLQFVYTSPTGTAAAERAAESHLTAVARKIYPVLS